MCQVEYQGLRRFHLLSTSRDHSYLTAAAEWYDDEPSAGAATDQLEQELYAALQRVAQLSGKLAHEQLPLPAELLK